MKYILITFCIFTATLLINGSILDDIDNNNAMIDDQQMAISVTITDNSGQETGKKLVMYQKGSEKRLIFFTAPADDRGIGFLSLPGNEMYMYLPAYSTVKKIASHVRNSSFAGTDFAYEDMDIVNYSQMYDYTVESETDSMITLILTLKDGKVSTYHKLSMNVIKDLDFPVSIEYYNKQGKHLKTLIYSDIEKENDYVYALKAKMVNISTGSVSVMTMSDVHLNTGLSDDFFTVRTLERGL